MNIQERNFARFLSLLDSAGCLEHVIVIGSWAELLYRENGLLGSFEPNIRTLDMDFLVRNMRKPSPAISLTSFAKEEGYLVESDRITGATKIFDPSGLEVEFLIGKRGAGEEPSLKTNLGVTAQALRHMEILVRGMITVDYFGMRVNVPKPEAYAVHKMAINHDRGAKSEKDAAAVIALWPYLNSEETLRTIEGLTKRERVHVQEFMEKHDLHMT